MHREKTVKAGDRCPQCDGGTLRLVRVPTEDQWRASQDRENPVYLPDGMDTASPAFREEFGRLHRCDACGYQARILAPPAPAAAADPPA